MSPEYQDAYQIGLSRGWQHASHSECVSGEPADAERDSESAEIPVDLTDDEVPWFITGYRDGIDRYNNGQHPDGSPADYRPASTRPSNRTFEVK